MRHKNKVRQLGRTHSHRKAMFENMVTSLFEHERIVTTKQKGNGIHLIISHAHVNRTNYIQKRATKAYYL